MATLTVQTPTTSGVALTYGSVAASDKFANDGKVFLHVKNGGASPDTVTIVCQTACNYGSSTPTHDLTVSVTNGADRMIGPFPTSRFNDANGDVTVNHSYTTTVTVAAIRGG